MKQFVLLLSIAIGGVHLDRVTQSVDKFIDNFCNQLEKLAVHDYVAKQQSIFFNETKERLNDNEIIALMDFSENLGFEIQDAAQAYYYTKDQCTIHPICLYYKQNSEIKHKTIIIIAESLTHTVQTVYLFQTKLVQYITVFGNKKIIFFTDGAPSHYKNKKSFLYLSLFKTDFGIDAVWHFFATSHGKSPCDALGGAFKRNSKMHNMRNPSNPITSSKALFECSQTLSNSKTHFIHCTKAEQDAIERRLNTRFNRKIKTVEGTQSFHSFTPTDKYIIEARTLSTSIEKKNIQISLRIE